MAWRDFYESKDKPQALSEVVGSAPSITPAEAIASVAAPVVIPPVQLEAESINPGGQLATESGVTCVVEGTAMPPPKKSDGSRLCSNIRSFMG